MTGFNHFEDGASAGSRPSLQDIERELESDVELLTDDEIANAPECALDEALSRLGLGKPVLSDAQLERLMDGGRIAPPKQGVSHIVPVGFTDALLKSLKAEKVLRLQGAAGSGKSYFIKEIFLTDQEVRRVFPRVTYVDSSGLRMHEPALLEREAVWAQFGTNDEAFREFLAGCGEPFGSGSLLNLLKRKSTNGGLFIFDNMDHLNRGGGVSAWVQEHLLPALEKLGVCALFIDRGEVQNRPFPALRNVKYIQYPTLNATDIDVWLDQPALRRHTQAGLNARSVLRMTGGVPVFIRDLGQFLLNTKFIGVKALTLFAKWRLSIGFMSEVERFVRAARRHDVVLRQVISAQGFTPFKTEKLPIRCQQDLLATGAVRLGKGGELVFASPLISRRIRTVLGSDTFALCLLRLRGHQLVTEGLARKLWSVAEVATDPLARAIAFERDPIGGLKVFQEILMQWGLRPIRDEGAKPSIYVRDQDNARLWSPFDRPDRLGPFYAARQPEVARAVQTGQSSLDDEGRAVLPITGNFGLVEMVVTGRFSQRWSHVRQLIELSRLEGLLRSMRPTLAQVSERLAGRRERRFEKRMLHMAKRNRGTSRHEILAHAGCQSLAVLERDEGRWGMARCERIGSARTAQETLSWADMPNSARLDPIANHASRRGLVLSGREMWDVFPRLTGVDALIYLHPVHRSNGSVILVAFLFVGSNRVLDGKLQYHLSVVAPDVSLLAS